MTRFCGKKWYLSLAVFTDSLGGGLGGGVCVVGGVGPGGGEQGRGSGTFLNKPQAPKFPVRYHPSGWK